MTCIVGLESNGKVYIAGDIQGTGGNNKVIHTQPKVFNKKGVLFGYTTSYRFGQILEHNLQDPVVPERDEEVYRWLITVLVPEIKNILKNHSYEGGGNCLIGVKGQLWELQNDFSVLRSVLGYASVGSGYEYALGSLCTSLSTASLISGAVSHELFLKTAIRVAGTFSPTVGMESTVLSV